MPTHAPGPEPVERAALVDDDGEAVHEGQRDGDGQHLQTGKAAASAAVTAGERFKVSATVYLRA